MGVWRVLAVLDLAAGLTALGWIPCSKDRQGCWLLCGPHPETFEKMAFLIMAGSASHKWKLRQIMHIFTKCKLPPVLLPYITGMTCGLKFVFVFVHDYLFGLWIFLESLTLEARLKLVGYMATHKGMYKYTVEKVIPQPFKYPTCGCSMELPFHCLTIPGFASTEICWIKSVFLSFTFLC